MSFSTQAFIEDLRTHVAAVWTDVDQVWDAERIDMEAWKARTLPYAVILIESLPRSHGWGLTNLTFEPEVSVWYVGKTDGNADGLITKLDALVNHFWPSSPLTAGQVLDIGDVSWSEELYPNQVLRQANRKQRVGMVVLKCVFGVTNQ